MRIALRALQWFCGFALCAAVLFSWVLLGSFVSHLLLFRDHEKYRPEIFVVTGAQYHHGEARGLRAGSSTDSWWLQGTIAGQEECLVPSLGDGPRPRSEDDLLARFPVGQQIPVLYNPEATKILVQDTSLRVQEARPDFWRKEARLRLWLGLQVLVPVPVTLGLYLAVRRGNRRCATKGRA